MGEAVLALALAGWLAAPGLGPPPVVVGIELRSEVPAEELEQVPGLIAIEIGEPLDPAAVRRTLTNLHATGLAREVETWVRPAPGGVVAVVVLRANIVVEEVRFEGDLGLSTAELARVSGRGKGQPLSEARVLQGVYALQDLYRQQGFIEASVRVAMQYRDPAARRAVVVFRVASGARAQVGTVSLEGDLGPFSAAELLGALRVEPGAAYRQAAAREAAERLGRWLIDRGHRQAQVEGPAERYEASTHSMDLTYVLSVGPRVEVEVLGASRDELQRKGLLPFLGEEGYDEALVLQALDRIERSYQERGHHDVEAQTSEEREDGLLRLTLTVVPGPEYTLEELRFAGNEAVSDEQLARLCATSPRRFLALGSGRLVDDVLAADLDNVRAYYALQGFAEARVFPPRIERRGPALAVEVAIEEGRQSRVASLAIEGTEAFAAGDLGKALESSGLLVPGGPYHPVLLDDSLRLLRARYEAAGYDGAQVSAATDWNEAGDRVAVTFRVLEGTQTVVDRVIVRGNQKTHGPVVRRAVDLEPGEPVSGARLLEAQRRLYRLGAFSRAEVSLAPADPGTAGRDVLVRVEEGKTRRLVYGVGYDSEDGPRGLVGFSAGNVAGRGFTLGADLRVSLGKDLEAKQGDRRARLTFHQPYVRRLELPLTYTLFYEVETRDPFDAERFGGRAEAERKLGEHHRAGLIYDYREVRPETAAAQSVPDPEGREDSPIRISSLIPNVLFDHRDDPIDPTRGASTFAQLQYAFPFLDTNEEFLKVFVQQTHHFRLGGAWVLAASLRAGGIEPFRAAGDAPLVPPELPSSRVSIAERLFAGGSTTHRAYGRDELGIVGETVFLVGDDEGGQGLSAVGGNGLLLVNLDLRFPVAGAVGGVLFLDAGNVWADWRDIDAGQAKLGVGVGVRYRSPIGPLRLEIGWKLDREPLEDAYQVFLSIGNPF